MTWTYTGDIVNNKMDRVRFYLGDTHDKNQLFQDEEIQGLLTLYQDSVNATIKQGFIQLLARFAREVDYTIGPEKVAAGDRFKQYQQMHKEFLKNIVGSQGYPLGEGISTPPTDSCFDIGMHDYSGETYG